MLKCVFTDLQEHHIILARQWQLGVRTPISIAHFSLSTFPTLKHKIVGVCMPMGGIDVG